MKCLYIGKFDNYYSTENYVTYALNRLGVEVEKVDSTMKSLDQISYKLNTWKPDFVLFSKAKVKSCQKILDNCKRLGIKTVCWQFDLYWGYRGQRAMPPQFWSNHLFTTDGGHEEAWKRIGCNHHLLRQGIHEPDYLIFPSQPRWDVGFVGSLEGHPSRTRLVQWLRQTYGSQFRHMESIRGQALNLALAECRVIVGDSYPSAHYWSNRIYEMLGRGAFLVYPETVGLESEFTDGKDYVSYQRGDFEGLRSLIQSHRDFLPDRTQIRQRGWEKCSQYTYTTRAAELLRIAGLSRTRVVAPTL